MNIRFGIRNRLLFLIAIMLVFTVGQMRLFMRGERVHG